MTDQDQQRGDGDLASSPTAMNTSFEDDYDVPTNAGNLLGGLALGFFCGCIGLLIAYVGNFGAETKKGAAIGFGVGLVVGVISRLLAAN